MCAPVQVWRSEATCRSSFSSFPVWILGGQTRVVGLSGKLLFLLSYFTSPRFLNNVKENRTNRRKTEITFNLHVLGYHNYYFGGFLHPFFCMYTCFLCLRGTASRTPHLNGGVTFAYHWHITLEPLFAVRHLWTNLGCLYNVNAVSVVSQHYIVQRGMAGKESCL